MLIGYSLHSWTPRWIFTVFIGISFALLLAHFANFTMLRLMDTPLSYMFKFFFGCGFEHFRVAFLAMNMNSSMVALIIGALITVPLCGIGFYRLTQKISGKNPLTLSGRQLVGFVVGVSLFLFSLDFLARPYLSLSSYRKYRKTLPLGSTFLEPPSRCLSLSDPIPPLSSEEDIQRKLSSLSLFCKKKPPLFVFIIETLRKDCIDEHTAPHLYEFGRQNVSPEISFANANSTHLSWFSIFHANYPYYWTSARDQWTGGSVPLQILKKMGYSIQVYSSADLSYFNMDTILFGKQRSLVSCVKEASIHRHMQPWERDALVMETLEKDMETSSEATAFLIFLDATHSEYSYPPSFPVRFEPAASCIDYLAISHCPEDLLLLKNRYRNSISYVDSLLGHFFEKLKEQNLYEHALIAITGDHGEEFFEEGALFHGTHLNEWQTSVPIFYKFPGELPDTFTNVGSHLDMFPSILHFLTGKCNWEELMNGQSIFAPSRWPFLLCVQHNGIDVPHEFSLFDGQYQFIGRFLTPPSIHSIAAVEICSLKRQDQEINLSSTLPFWQKYLEGAFRHLIYPQIAHPPATTDLEQIND